MSIETREQVKKKVMELIDRDFPHKLKETANHILESGEVDTSTFDGNYKEAMTVLSKALHEESFQYAPLKTKRKRYAYG